MRKFKVKQKISHSKLKLYTVVGDAYFLCIFAGLEYILEKQKQPGKALDLELPLSSMDTHDFCLLRMNSKLNYT